MRGSITLGLQLALASHGSRTRQALMSVGFAIAMCVLLFVVALLPAQAARRGRELARFGTPFEGTGLPRNGTLMWPLGTNFEGEYVQSIALVGRGRAPIPPGLNRLPRPGEVFASPALADMLSRPESHLLAPRVPGELKGTITPDGLLHPGELFAYVGAPSSVSARRHEAQVVTSFEAADESIVPLDATGAVVVGLIAVAGLVPVAVFVMGVTRLSAATRERRLAAIRLVGATQSQIRRLAAVEASIGAWIGCLVGIPLFLSIRTVVSSIPVADYRAFPSDYSPSVWAVALLVIVLTGSAVCVSMIAMRRIVVSPLGIVRRLPPTRVTLRWPVALGLGLGALTVAAAAREWVAEQSAPVLGILTAAAMVSVLVGVAGTGPWAGWKLASAVSAAEPPPFVLLGTRNLQSEPTSASRIVGGVTMLVALVAVAQAVALAGGSSSRTPPGVDALQPGTVVARAFRHAAILNTLDEVSGVGSVTVSRRDPDGTVCARPCVAIVFTDGRPATVERIRNRLAWIGTAETLEELRTSRAVGDARDLVGLMEIGIGLALLITAAGLVVSTADGLIERKQAIAILSAIGVRGTTIAMSVLVQVGLPLIVGVILGIVSGLWSAALLLQIVGDPVRLSVSATFVTAGVVVAVVFLITAATSPWIRSSRRPELLRFE